MQVKLRVIGGRNNGREISIPKQEFIIGRGEEAHLRPNSDLVSRTHCSLKIEDGVVNISDMGSRNGTYVNGQRLTERHVAKSGDLVRVGRLQFEVLIDHAQAGNKRPKVNGVAEVAARTAASKGSKNFDEESVFDWLAQDEDESESSEDESLQETQMFQLDETRTKLFTRSDEMESDNIPIPESTDAPKSEKKRIPPKKLPKRADKSTNTKSAADEVLRQFFNRG